MDAPGLPGRPRLAEHAMARRHFVDGDEIVVVHDTRTGDLVRMPPRAWALIEAADGTRDLGGLLLAASQRGALHRTSEVVSVLTDLHAQGLLTDGIDPFALARSDAAEGAAAPLDVLPFALTCDGSGSCCATYSTVRFSEDEAARARALLPGVANGRARTFLPLLGSGAQTHVAATAIDGQCSYCSADGACELHRTHGASAKPSGCALYPATFVFDGEAVRVSLGFECACVEKSIGRREGVPLVPASATVRADLPEGAQIATLAETLELAPGKTAARADVVRWSRAALHTWRALTSAEAPTVDAIAALWSLAARVEEGDLSEPATRTALATPTPPSFEALTPWLTALAARTAARRESADRWRSPRDRVRVASALLAEVAASLHDQAITTAALAPSGQAPSGQASSPSAAVESRRRVEAFYVTAALHGHALLGEIPLAHALRDRAVRLLLARAAGISTISIQGADPGRSHPLPLVEAMMRAQGLHEYARDLLG